ncbi:MAG: DUF5069 domain-containing protein [Verrucomicrobia subdivision 3 bacterium]|nr:DUF5069 domain-containing protein [Limisphaerales bacterium]
MAGWIYLPRLIDKIRLNLAGKLHEDYQPNFLHRGFDGKWFESAGVDAGDLTALVAASDTDGQVADWVRHNVNARLDSAVQAAFNDAVGNYGADESDADLRARLAQRKEDAGMGARNDIQCFVDFIDADEGRL